MARPTGPNSVAQNVFATLKQDPANNVRTRTVFDGLTPKPSFLTFRDPPSLFSQQPIFF